MRKDVKTGMVAGTVVCLIATVWFCVKQQIISRPVIKVEAQNIVESEYKTSEVETDNLPIAMEKPAIPAVVPEPFDNNKTMIIHTVQQGETLSDISKMYYNTPGRWREIYEANKDKFPKGPDTIRTGTRLAIPQ